MTSESGIFFFFFFFSLFEKNGSVGRWETKHFIGMALPVLEIRGYDRTSDQRLNQGTHNYSFYAFYPGNLAKIFVNGKDIPSSR